MPTKHVKTVHIYDVRRVRPALIESLRDAEDGEFVAAERVELDSFVTLEILDGQMERMYEERTGQKLPKKKAAGKG